MCPLKQLKAIAITNIYHVKEVNGRTGVQTINDWFTLQSMAILLYLLAIVWSCTSFTPDGGYWLYNQLIKSVIFPPVSNSNFQIFCLQFVVFENFDY